jgi:hypothetical protein
MDLIVPTAVGSACVRFRWPVLNRQGPPRNIWVQLNFVILGEFQAFANSFAFSFYSNEWLLPMLNACFPPGIFSVEAFWRFNTTAGVFQCTCTYNYANISLAKLLPPSICGCILLRNGYHDRKHLGRIYWPFITDDDLEGSYFTDAFALRMEALQDVLVDGVSILEVGIHGAVWSRSLDTFTYCPTIQFPKRATFMRKRKPKHAKTYPPLAWPLMGFVF